METMERNRRRERRSYTPEFKQVELTRFPAHVLLSHRLRFEVGW